MGSAKLTILTVGHTTLSSAKFEDVSMFILTSADNAIAFYPGGHSVHCR